MALSLSQKMFLQVIMHRGILDSHAVKDNFKICRERYGEDISMDHLREFLKGINGALRPLHMEIKKGMEEETGGACYVLVNTVDNDYLMNAGKFNQKHMDYFKALLRLIMLSEDGLVSMVDALNCVDTLENKIQKKEAAELVESWVQLNWLKASVSTVTLNTRAIMELEHYICEVFQESVKDCNICNRICVQGLVCPHCDCKVHHGCMKSYLTQQSCEAKCPNPACGEQRPDLVRVMVQTKKKRTSLRGGVADDQT